MEKLKVNQVNSHNKQDELKKRKIMKKNLTKRKKYITNNVKKIKTAHKNSAFSILSVAERLNV